MARASPQPGCQLAVVGTLVERAYSQCSCLRGLVVSTVGCTGLWDSSSPSGVPVHLGLITRWERVDDSHSQGNASLT